MTDHPTNQQSNQRTGIILRCRTSFLTQLSHIIPHIYVGSYIYVHIYVSIYTYLCIYASMYVFSYLSIFVYLNWYLDAEHLHDRPRSSLPPSLPFFLGPSYLLVTSCRMVCVFADLSALVSCRHAACFSIIHVSFDEFLSWVKSSEIVSKKLSSNHLQKTLVGN